MLFEKIELEADEKILKMVRKHWFVIFSELFGTFSLILLPFFLLFVSALFPQIFDAVNIHPSDYTKVLSFTTASWLVLCMMSGFMIWTHYYLDLWIITDRRIILIDQVQFFNRNVSIFRLERLQDIEFSIRGIIPTFLNFGTLNAQTAGHAEIDFKTTGLPDPRGLQAIIQKAMDARLDTLHIRPDQTR